MVVFRPAGAITVEGRAEIGRRICPPTTLPAFTVSAISPAITSLLAMTPGKFITSPSPMMFGQVIASATSATDSARTRMFQARRGGNAARHLHMHVDRHGDRLVVHQPDAVQPQHIGDLVRVDEHRGGAMRNDGAAELGDA